ncbi:anaerobic ribonucleoside-triphosphate reductase activating protein [Phosphitispora sp. TUW77]|uniref:anaerobic ribonucleoside-triphosphate reductase activating protein n=1 Tax=Phosphitispora sp. TUW77 TaxID=3152361 RepID=UPI003AB6BC1E
MKIRVAGIIEESVVDGPGIRIVVFAQGCPRFCKGCHNPAALDPAGGYDMEENEILNLIEKTKLAKGVTFSGGEPFMQATAFVRLGKKVRQKGLDIMTYTGYTWEELFKISEDAPAVRELIEISDYLVDGPYMEAKKDLTLPFRGSANQRIIDVRKSLQTAEVVIAVFE